MPQDWPDYYASQKADETAYANQAGVTTPQAQGLVGSDVVGPNIVNQATAFNGQWTSVVALETTNDKPLIAGVGSAMDVQSAQKVTSGNPALNHLYP